MSPGTKDGGRRGFVYAVAATVALLLVGAVVLFLGSRGTDGPPAPAAASALTTSTSAPSTSAPTPPASAPPAPSSPAASTPPAPASQAPGASIGQFVGASAPTGIDIPSVGIRSTTFVDLSVSADGTLSVPGTANEVGFYTGGPTPGQLGPAVLGAHVDSTQGPGIFFRLGAIKPGAEIKVNRADGSVTTFTVDKVATYPKDRFPTEEVYRGDFTKSEIRLVTCGGAFEVKHYLDNVVVFGHLTQAA